MDKQLWHLLEMVKFLGLLKDTVVLLLGCSIVSFLIKLGEQAHPQKGGFGGHFETNMLFNELK